VTDAAEPPTLSERSLALREQLQAQRGRIAAQLGAGAHGGYPRSVTMRVLLASPELATLLMSRVVGPRTAAALRALLIVVQALSFFATNQRAALASQAGSVRQRVYVK
jgi:hypothetical protein